MIFNGTYSKRTWGLKMFTRGLHCVCCFPANGWTNPEVSLPRSFCIPREILPQNFSSLGLTALEELWNKQTHKLTNILLQNIFYHSKHVWLFWALSVQHLRSRRNIHSKFWDCIFKGEILKFWMMIPFGLQMVLV